MILFFKLNDTFHQAFTVSGKVYEGFIEIFNDRNPLHIDDGFAQNKGFQKKVMQGNILNGFLSFFIGECLPTKNVIIHSQEIQYKLPVYQDDELDFEAVVTGIHESVNAVEFSFRFFNSGNRVVSKGKIQIGLLL